MKRIKKALSLLLAFVMVISLLPMAVLAVELDGNLAPDGEVAPAEGRERAEVSPKEEPLPEGVDEAELAVDAYMAASVLTGTRPADGQTSGQPFAAGTGGSQNFRIPAMVTLDDGTIVAACDARWNTTADGGGLDTIVSYSNDDGATWHYTFANYLGDNGNTHNSSSTAFIDPSLATDGSTVYMLVDLFAYGVALNGANQAPSTDTGFDANGRLALTNGGVQYYLENGKIYNANNNAEVSGYVVNSYFNITGKGSNTNLFASDSPFQVQRTGFLYFTKSEDGGKTWSAPRLINAKKSGEEAYLVGPAGGFVSSTGRILFPCYNYQYGTESASVLYSDDGGATWTRSANVDSDSSEATITEVNGKLYMFARHGGYYVSADDGATWSAKKSVGISYTTSCEMDVMAYSRKIDGKDAILLSAGTNGRANGKIFVGLVQADGSLTWPYSYQVNNSTFQYSALAELEDGTIGLLYENGSASIRFETLAMETIAPTAQIAPAMVAGGSISDEAQGIAIAGAEAALESIVVTPATVEAISGDYVAFDITLNGGAYTGAAQVTIPLPAALQTAGRLTAFVLEDGAPVPLAGGQRSADGSSYSFTVPHFSVVGAMALPETDMEIREETYSTPVYRLDVDDIDSGAEYVIVTNETANAGGPRVLYNVSGNASTDQLTCSLSDTNFTESSTVALTATNFAESTQLWTVTAVQNGYVIRGNNSGTYLNLAKTTTSKANLSASQTTGTVLTITQNGTAKVISYSGSAGTSNYLVHAASNTQFYTSTGSSGSNLYFYKKTTAGYTTDNSLLLELCQTAAALKAGEYSADSWAALQQALAAATSLDAHLFWDDSAKAQAEQDAINTAAKSLNDALKALVQAKPIALVVGETVTLTDLDGDLDATGLDAAIAAVSLTNGTLTVTGLAVGQTQMTIGGELYSITVKPEVVSMDTTPFLVRTGNTGAGEKVTKLTLSTDVTYQVDVQSNLAGGSWSIDDPAVASVDDNGTVTALSAGSAIAYYAAPDGKTYAMPVDVLYTGNAATRTLYSFHVAEQLDTIAWYSVNICGDENQFRQTEEGEVIYVKLDATNNGSQGSNMLFYAKPVDTGYALTTMGATNSLGNYQAINSADPAETDLYKLAVDGKFVVYNLLRAGYSATEVQADIQAAINLGADGGMGFSRGPGNTGAADCDLTFRSRKLPDVTKTVDGIMPAGKNTAEDFRYYTEGMTGNVGDKVYFNVTVTQYATPEAITYDDEILRDNLANASFVVYDAATDTLTQLQTLTQSGMLADGILVADLSYDYLVEYEIQESDLGKDIINTVDFTYTYKSQYSSGRFDAAANAEARISTLVVIPHDFVVDFGLPLTIDYTAPEAHGQYDLASGSAKHGTVTVSNNMVTYTPNEVLQEVETVTLTNTMGGTANIKIYPASSVYYNESFAHGDFTPQGMYNHTVQAEQVAGSSTDEYGYDTHVAAESGMSCGTYSVSASRGDKQSFAFTGTGVDVYVNGTESSGTAAVLVQNASGGAAKLMLVNTATAGIYGGNQNGLPVVSLHDLPHGTYTVQVVQAGVGTVMLDGFRVYNTLADEPDFYADDLEDNPSYVELRNRVLTAMNIGGATVSVYDQVNAVLNGEAGNVTAVVLGSGETSFHGLPAQDLLEKGPKNELFLSPGQTVVFKVSTDREVQLGMKAVQGQTSAQLACDGTEAPILTLQSCTDMFYTVKAAGSAGEHTISVTNDGSALLSITKVKLCDDPSAMQSSLTEADLAKVLDELGLITKGDADGNGKLTLVDVAQAFRLALQDSGNSPYLLKLLDMNGDGKLNVMDVSLLYARYTGG